MTREQMMEKIASKLTAEQEVVVFVSHRGDWNGADVYTITHDGFAWTGHKWGVHGTLRKTYRKYVLAKETGCK